MGTYIGYSFPHLARLVWCIVVQTENLANIETWDLKIDKCLGVVLATQVSSLKWTADWHVKTWCPYEKIASSIACDNESLGLAFRGTPKIAKCDIAAWSKIRGKVPIVNIVNSHIQGVSFVCRHDLQECNTVIHVSERRQLQRRDWIQCSSVGATYNLIEARHFKLSLNPCSWQDVETMTSMNLSILRLGFESLGCK